ncbi:hypothetical protein [Rhizobium sp. BK176]|uniref:hypothetical protein n=1 Tax=Rhizobium sp. BK176 TaxID=2587071 RepID=UPI00216777F1|nr:hypothetical protein [Rhizobium sp. BK176]MCS4089734.1 hypothetical protein [Rhizobium sp. BK176]
MRIRHFSSTQLHNARRNRIDPSEIIKKLSANGADVCAVGGDFFPDLVSSIRELARSCQMRSQMLLNCSKGLLAHSAGTNIFTGEAQLGKTSVLSNGLGHPKIEGGKSKFENPTFDFDRVFEAVPKPKQAKALGIRKGRHRAALFVSAEGL